MKLVWDIQLPRRQRIGLLGIFGAGGLVCISGALRLYYTITTHRSSDPTWLGFYLWTWESVEINLGIVCASAPCLKAFFVKVFPKLGGSSNGTIRNSSVMARMGRGGYVRSGSRGGDLDRSRGICEIYGLSDIERTHTREKGIESRIEERSKSEESWDRGRDSEHVLVAKVDMHERTFLDV